MAKKARARRIGPGVKYSALKLSQNDQDFYYSTIPVEDLFQYCAVSRRDEDPERGFQRVLARDRAEDIAKYLSGGNGSIPTNIVLSAQENAELKFNDKQISFSREPSAFIVLDGQHRLWGYQICFEQYRKSYRVPVAIYQGLSRADEAKLFIDINTNQRGVPATLLLDIKQVAQVETAMESTLRTLFDFLNKDESSPIKGMMTPSKAVKGKINRVTFNRSLSGPLRSIGTEMDEEKFRKLVINYLKALESALKSFSSLKKASVFESMFAVMDDVVRISMSNFGDARIKSLSEIMQSMNAVDLKASKAILEAALRVAVKSNVKIGAVEL